MNRRTTSRVTSVSARDVASQAEDPNGPRAKTAELKLKPPSAIRAALAMLHGAQRRSRRLPPRRPRRITRRTLSLIRASSRSPRRTAAVDVATVTPDGEVTLTEAIAPRRRIPSRAAAVETRRRIVHRCLRVAAAAAEAAADRRRAPEPTPPPGSGDDLGEVFGRVIALSMTLNHPAFQRALEGFAAQRPGLSGLSRRANRRRSPRRAGGLRMSEADAIAVAIQVCQAVAFVNRRGLRVNDICPESVVVRRRRPHPADRPRLHQQRQRAAGRAALQRRLHRARDLQGAQGR